MNATPAPPPSFALRFNSSATNGDPPICPMPYNGRTDLRYYTHLAESLNVPSIVGEAVHQSLSTESALGHGRKQLQAPVNAQEQLTGAKIAPR